jgi:hypothetical protein
MFLLLMLLFTAGCGDTRTPIRYYLPKPIPGILTVTWGEPHAPPLTVVDGYLVADFRTTNSIVTSTPFQEGWAKDEVFRFDSSGLDLGLDEYQRDVLIGFRFESNSLSSKVTETIRNQ